MIARLCSNLATNCDVTANMFYLKIINDAYLEIVLLIFFQNEEQIKAFFMKIDYNSDGLIDWVCHYYS